MPKRVLIAADSRNVILMIEKCLKNKGFKVEKASDGVEALVKIFDTLPDIILLDIMLPRLGGLMICEAVRLNEKFLNTAVIAMSTVPNEEELKSILEGGANDYIIKPFTPSELMDKLRKYTEDGK